MEAHVSTAFILTILAGLSTGIGSLVAFFIRGRSLRILSFAMGLAAGVMLDLSCVEMLPHAHHELEELLLDAHDADLYSLVAFFGGLFLAGLIDRFVPHQHVPVQDGNLLQPQDTQRLLRVGTMTALALAIHNFPEGVATFVAALEDPHLGIAMALAIALHNIPEGIAVSMPIYYATGSRRKAFWYSFSSGLVEPLGAFLSYFLLSAYLTPLVMSLLVAAVAGIMVFIALDQLIPTAHQYDSGRASIYGIACGMLVMAISLHLLMSHGHAH